VPSTIRGGLNKPCFPENVTGEVSENSNKKFEGPELNPAKISRGKEGKGQKASNKMKDSRTTLVSKKKCTEGTRQFPAAIAQEGPSAGT